MRLARVKGRLLTRRLGLGRRLGRRCIRLRLGPMLRLGLGLQLGLRLGLRLGPRARLGVRLGLRRGRGFWQVNGQVEWRPPPSAAGTGRRSPGRAEQRPPPGAPVVAAAQERARRRAHRPSRGQARRTTRPRRAPAPRQTARLRRGGWSLGCPSPAWRRRGHPPPREQLREGRPSRVQVQLRRVRRPSRARRRTGRLPAWLRV